MSMPTALGSNDLITPAGDPLDGLPFRALRRLGSSTTGEVYLAEHRQLGKLCAVKILPLHLVGDEVLAERFMLAARALGHLRSPHIVSVSGAGTTTDGRPFIVMELMEGRTVAEELKARGSLPLHEALDYVCQLLQGLAAAHASGIVHRDVRPANLFLCDGPDGARTLKVVDFGLTRIVPDAPEGAPEPLTVPTTSSAVLGAPAYVSPEGARGLRVDHRADLYASALVLYCMVAGRGPFDHLRSAALVLSAHVAETPSPLSDFAKAPVPPELDSLLLKALRKDPSERFQSAHAFREALEQVQARLAGSVRGMTSNTLDVSSFSVPVRGATEYPARAEVLAIAKTAQSGRQASDRPPDARPSSTHRSDATKHRHPEFLIGLRESALIFFGTAALAAIAAAALVGGVR